MMTKLSEPLPQTLETELARKGSAHRLRQCVMIGIGLVPMMLMVQWVWRYGVNIPYWDQWGMLYVLDLAAHGELRWEHLFQQHNESRKVFPKLLFVGLGQLTGWNVRFEMGVIVLLAAVTSLNIYVLARRTVARSPLLAGWSWAPAGLWFLANLLIFSPVQHENWLWGIQVVVFIPIALLTTGLVVSTSQSRLWVKALLCAVLAFVATFSYANGLLLWVLLGAGLVVLHWASMRRQWWLMGLYGAAFVAVVWWYFHDYHRPPYHPPFSDGLRQPVNLVLYFLAFLGSPLRLGFEDEGRQLAWARWAGIALVAMFGAACVYCVYVARRDRAVLLRSVAPWVLLCGYALISALITAAGRVGFGEMQALVSRYTSFSVYLAVGLVFIGSIVLAHVAERSRRRSGRMITAAAAGVIVLTLVTSHVLTSIPAVHRMQDTKRQRLEGKAMLHWYAFAPELVIQHRLHPLPERLQEMSKRANVLGLLTPPLARSPVPVDATVKGVEYGYIDGLVLGDGRLHASGWAVLPHRRRPSDAVLLTWQVEGSEPHVFAVVPTLVERRDVSRYLGDRRFRESGWRRAMEGINLPEGTVISAWAFDAETALAFRLAQQSSVPVQP